MDRYFSKFNNFFQMFYLQFPETDEPFSQVQERLNQSSLTLNAAANDVVHAAKGPTGQLAKASAKFSHSYQDFQNSGLTLAGQIKDKEAQDNLINDLRKTSTVSSRLLLASKSLAADPGAPNAKNLLAAAAKYVLKVLFRIFSQSNDPLYSHVVLHQVIIIQQMLKQSLFHLLPLTVML